MCSDGSCSCVSVVQAPIPESDGVRHGIVELGDSSWFGVVGFSDGVHGDGGGAVVILWLWRGAVVGGGVAATAPPHRDSEGVRG